ncbi:MAG TPA: TetR family transcriptional regulator [Bacillota bacterium]|jgi:AcrR family transcriptional regulator|nr:TetR family transcriptional regulator [Bacillota bacterium]
MANNKEIQRKRMMSYFIKATEEVIETEGIDAVTIRKVAHMAAYNSATIYNYFDDVEHLILYTMIKYLKDYTKSLSTATKTCGTPEELMITVWENFCAFAFSRPKVFYKLFFEKNSIKVQDTLKDYYEIFPEDLGDFPNAVAKMLKESDINKRCYTILSTIVPEEKRMEEYLLRPNRIIVFALQGLLYNAAEGIDTRTPDEISAEMLSIVKYVIKTL